MVVCTGGFPVAANGKVIYVNGSSGSDSNSGATWFLAKKTIKNATGTVKSGGTVHIADGVYKGANNGNITINKNMSIIGQSQTGNIIDAEHQDRIFLITSGVTVNLRTLTLADGTAVGNGGAIVNAHGTLKLTNITFRSNTASDGGGAILNGFGILTVIRSIFTGNKAKGVNGNGGAIVNGGGTFMVTDSTFNWNTANDGGGAILNGGGTLKATGSTFMGNTARENGGAILSAGGVLAMANSDLINNMVGGRGGAIYNGFHDVTGVGDIIKGRGNFTVTGSNLIGNTAASGGAIYNNGGHGEVHFNRILQNVIKDLVSSPGLVDARYNWWGSNRNPSNRVSGNVLVDPWLIANINAHPVDSFIITVNLLYDSHGNYHDPHLGHAPDGIPVTFYSASGALNPGLSNIVSGIATSIFTPTTFGKAVVYARVDDQLLSIVTNSSNPNPSPSSANAIPMQETGTPLYPLLMTLMVIGGSLLISRRK